MTFLGIFSNEIGFLYKSPNEANSTPLEAIRRIPAERGLRSILESILLKTMFDLPSQENIEEVIIDAGAAKGQTDPIIIHSKEVKSKTEKTSAA